jgi:hypothetical protein
MLLGGYLLCDVYPLPYIKSITSSAHLLDDLRSQDYTCLSFKSLFKFYVADLVLGLYSVIIEILLALS